MKLAFSHALLHPPDDAPVELLILSHQRVVLGRIVALQAKPRREGPLRLRGGANMATCDTAGTTLPSMLLHHSPGKVPALQRTSLAWGERSEGVLASAAPAFAAASAFIFFSRVRAAAGSYKCQERDHTGARAARAAEGEAASGALVSAPRSFCRSSPGVLSRNEAFAMASSSVSISLAPTSAATALAASSVMAAVPLRCLVEPRSGDWSCLAAWEGRRSAATLVHGVVSWPPELTLTGRHECKCRAAWTCLSLVGPVIFLWFSEASSPTARV